MTNTDVEGSESFEFGSDGLGSLLTDIVVA